MDVRQRLLMQVLIDFLRRAPREKLADLLRAHSCHSGHCDACHTIWPCTLWSAGTAATRPVQPEVV